MLDHLNNYTNNSKYQRAKNRLLIALVAIGLKAADLERKAGNYYQKNLPKDAQSKTYYHYKKAAKAARELLNTITQALEDYEKNYDKLALKNAITLAIQSACNSKLKKHRDHLKLALMYVGIALIAALAIVTAGIAYALACLVSFAITGQPFIFLEVNTDSINKVLYVEEKAQELLSLAP